MCGRFALFSPPARLGRLFAATPARDLPPGFAPSWNVAPTDTVLGVRERRNRDGAGDPEAPRVLDQFRWGLVPSWSKSFPTGARSFNARAETVATKPSFQRALSARRLVVPADGFYEWQHLDRRRGVPHFFHRRDGTPMALAGLWELWRAGEGADGHGDWLQSCTIITTEPSVDMAGIHDRMPVVLAPEAVDVWLDPDPVDPEELEALLRPAKPGTLSQYAVSRRVGDVRVNSPDLIDPVPDQMEFQPPASKK
jgi:putative SOS response-associated peptidase YedK